MSFPARAQLPWQLRSRVLSLGGRTLLMGIVNVTPDSFSDGGTYLSTGRAVEHALYLLECGADILDIGGESTRPGSPAGTNGAVSAQEEQARVLPVIAALRRIRPEAVLSVDTYRASTARIAVLAGVEIVNDVSGLLWDQEMAGTVAELGCGLVLTHTRGFPSAWTDQPALASAEVVPVVTAGLQSRTEAALAAGIARECIVLDPGFGFGKRGPENWALLAGFGQLGSLGFPLLAGASRKGFLAGSHQPGSPVAPASSRDLATHAAHTAAILSGAHIVRVHDVRGARQAANVADSLHRCSP